jgi:hypothetical protein
MQRPGTAQRIAMGRTRPPTGFSGCTEGLLIVRIVPNWIAALADVVFKAVFTKNGTVTNTFDDELVKTADCPGVRRF